MTRLLQWLNADNRKAMRFPLPGLVACYWAGGKPSACSIADISATGLYLITDERWFPGSLIPMTCKKLARRGRSERLDPRDDRGRPLGVGRSRSRILSSQDSSTCIVSRFHQREALTKSSATISEELNLAQRNHRRAGSRKCPGEFIPRAFLFSADSRAMQIKR